MGFNKRYVSESVIRHLVEEEGIDHLISFIRKSDALIIKDDFSQKVCDIILKRDKENIIKELEKIWQEQ